MALNIGKLFGRDREQMLNNKHPELDRQNAVSEGQGYGATGSAESHGVVMKDGANNVTLENYASTPGGDGGNPAAFELTPAGSHAQVHDIHMNQGNTQSLQQQMQNENQRLRETSRTPSPDAPEADGVMQHNQTDLEFVREPRPGITANDDWESPAPLKYETEVTDYREGGSNAKWELSELDASKNEVSIESLELAHEGVRGGSHNQQGVVQGNVGEDATAYALPEVGDEVLVEFQAKEPGRIEFPNLVQGAKHDTMELEEVHFIRGTARPVDLDDDGPSHLLGDTDGDADVDGTDAVSFNFSKVDLMSGIDVDGDPGDIDSDGLADDFDGIYLPD